MADFRKCIYAFAVLALLVGLAPTANAQAGPQAFQCVANAGVPPLMRSEGLTELTGDIVLNCTGGVEVPSGGTAPTVNLQVFLNTAVTSRLLGSNNVSEALLMIDEPAQGATTVCASGSTAANCNVYQGRVVGGNSVLFLGVPVLPPGTSRAAPARRARSSASFRLRRLSSARPAARPGPSSARRSRSTIRSRSSASCNGV
jgi:hypothetical protein